MDIGCVKELLNSELENVEEEIKVLGYKLNGLLHRDCSIGACTLGILDPELDNVQGEMKEKEKKKIVLEYLNKYFSSKN